MNVYMARGTHWSSISAHTSLRAARTAARRFRELDGASTVEHAESHDSLESYIDAHAITAIGGHRLVPCRCETPPRIERALTRRYGRPETVARGEVAYWAVAAQEARP